MIRRLSLVVAVCLSACSEGPVAPPDAGPVEPARVVVAKLSGLKPGVTLTRDGKTQNAVAGALYENDVIDTDATGHAVLRSDTTEVELLSDSTFRIGKSLSNLTVAAGDFVIEELDGGEFTTGAGSGRAPLGTRVRVALRDGGTSFQVTSGSFELFDLEDGGSTAVAPGSRYVVGAGMFTVEDVPHQPVVVPGAKPTLKLTPRGAVTLKPKSGPSVKLPPEGKTLDEAGTFVVDKGASLRAQVPGAELEFDSASKGTLEPQDGDPKVRALLSSGGLRIFLKAGQSVLLDGKRPLTLRAKTTMTALVTATPNGPRVEVLGGDGEASVPDSLPRNLVAGDVAVPKGKGLESGKRGAPVLVLPPNRNTRVFWARPAEVMLQFAPGEGELEVAGDAQFENVLVRAQSGDSLVVPAPLKGLVFWRRAGDAEPTSARFERDETAGAVTAKSDTVAETGLKATVYFQGAVPTLTFTFPPRDGAANWRFRVYSVAELKNALVDRRVSENRTVVDSGALKEGSYVWSAVALDKAGVEAPGGRMNKMDIVFDNSVTRLVLTSPKEGERSANAVGVAPLGSRLTLNGKAVALDEGGRFSTPVPAAPVLVFKLVTRDGAESHWVRRLGR